MKGYNYKNKVHPLQWTTSNGPAKTRGLKQVASLVPYTHKQIAVLPTKQRHYCRKELGVINGMDEVSGSIPLRSTKNPVLPLFM